MVHTLALINATNMHPQRCLTIRLRDHHCILQEHLCLAPRRETQPCEGRASKNRADEIEQRWNKIEFNQ